MAIPTAGLLEITLTQTIGTVILENVYYYHDAADVPPISLIGIATQFDIIIAQQQVLIQHIGVGFINIRVKDVLGTLPDFNVPPTLPGGLRVGEALANFYAVGFTLNGATKETRVGAKRMSGLSESDVIGNGPVAAYLTILQTFATQLALPLVTPTIYAPVIFGRLTPTRLVLAANPVVSATVNTFVTTQSSRKV